MKASISVVIPTFNRSQKIGEALKSVLAQTYPGLEIIIVDDGSADNTKQVVTSIEGPIQYFYKDNGGVSSARNYGIKKATGDYVAFLDSDDRWLPEKIEKQIKFLKDRPDFGMVLCDCFYVDERGRITGQSRRKNYLPKNGFILEHVLRKPSLIPSTALIKREILFQVGLFDEKLKTAEDLDLNLKIARHCKIGLIEKPLVYYERGGLGLSQLSHTYEDNVAVIERFINAYPAEIPPKVKKQTLFNVYYSATRGKIWLKEIIKALVFFRKAMGQASGFKDLQKMFGLILLLIKSITSYLKKI